MANYKNTEKLLNDAISNISDDRQCASKLLSDVMVILSSNNDSDMHKKLGEVASKYLETLQRSNEQLVKLAALSGKLSGGRQGFSKEDIESIYKDVIDGKE